MQRSATVTPSLASLISFTCISCCSNVISFESLIHLESHTSTLVTFCQYLFVALSSYLVLLYDQGFKDPWKLLSRPSRIPIHRYLLSTAGFCLASVLGNLVFRYDLSLPIHIIFRSSSTAFTMALGYLVYGNRYSPGQILGSTVMSMGIILVTYSNMADRFSFTGDGQNMTTFVQGLGILVGVTLLTSFLSLYNESSNKQVGGSKASWKENLFYSHLYGIPFFLAMPSTLKNEYTLVQGLRESGQFNKFWLLILVNASTQLLCVSGVNQLAVETNAVTLGVILLMRRFVSLLLSMILFRNRMSPLGMAATVMVFSGAGLYSYTVGKMRDSKKVKSKNE